MEKPINNGNSTDYTCFSNNDPRALEGITPYKLCLVVLINEYVLHTSRTPKFRRDFCMMIWKLVRSPDMDYTDLRAIVDSFEFGQEFIDKYIHSLGLENDIRTVSDMLNNLDLSDNQSGATISGNSRVGMFLRRVRISFEKLTFSQTITLWKAFELYHFTKKRSKAGGILERSGDEEGTKMDTDSEEDCEDIKHMPVRLWSKGQAELFLAQQTKYLVGKPSMAMLPQELQAKFNDILMTNPDQTDVHFVSYLNNLRVKDYCGAMDSVFHYFDRKQAESSEEDVKCQGFRFASLNLAILQAKFGRKQEAISAIKEAITAAHECNDSSCLNQAQAWLLSLQDKDRDILLKKYLSNFENTDLVHISSLLMYAEHCAKTGTPPCQIFEMLDKCEMLNGKYSHHDLLLTGGAVKCSLWSMYGKSDLALIEAQQILHLETPDLTVSVDDYCEGEAVPIAITLLIQYFTSQGDYNLSRALLCFGRLRIPDSRIWIWCESFIHFIEALRKGSWQHAHAAVNQLAAVDEIESLLRLSELLLAKGDKEGAHNAAQRALASTDSFHHLRASIAIAKINPQSNYLRLCDILQLTENSSFEFLNASVAMILAESLLKDGLGAQSHRLLTKKLHNVLSYGCFSSIADALIMLSKSRFVCHKNLAANKCKKDIYNILNLLKKAAVFAKKMQDCEKVKSIVYLQAIICNEKGLYTMRNTFAREFNTLNKLGTAA